MSEGGVSESDLPGKVLSSTKADLAASALHCETKTADYQECSRSGFWDKFVDDSARAILAKAMHSQPIGQNPGRKLRKQKLEDQPSFQIRVEETTVHADGSSPQRQIAKNIFSKQLWNAAPSV